MFDKLFYSTESHGSRNPYGFRLVKISMISTKPVHFKDKKKIGAKMFGMISITTHKNAPRIAVGELQL